MIGLSSQSGRSELFEFTILFDWGRCSVHCKSATAYGFPSAWMSLPPYLTVQTSSSLEPLLQQWMDQ